MSLVKPILENIASFDKRDETIFYFKSFGGDQVTGNKLTIKNASNIVVYDETLTNYKFQHLCDSSVLVNGATYTAYIQTKNASGDFSEPSNTIQFTCYTTPQLQWSNKPSDDTINNTQFNFEIGYTQIEGEKLNGLSVYIYNETGDLIDQSDTIYNTNVPPLTINYIYSPFENNTRYKMQAKGRTLGGTLIETEIYEFTCSYTSSGNFGSFTLTNDCENGWVELQTEITAITGVVEPSPPKYINSTLIDLTDEGAKLTFDEGVVFGSKFLTRLGVKLANEGKIFRSMNEENSGYTIEIKNARVGSIIKSVVEFCGFLNGTLVSYSRTDPMDCFNNLTILDIEAIADNGLLSVKARATSETDNLVVWNESSNVEYSKFTNLDLENGVFPLPPKTPYSAPMFVDGLESVELMNGMFDYFYVTKDLTSTFPTPLPTSNLWTVDTVLYCDFNNNVNGGNVNFAVDEISAVRIKRRLKGDFKWTTIAQHKINGVEDFNFSLNDKTAPSLHTFEYAYVPLLENSVEADYKKSEITTDFKGVYVADRQNSYQLLISPTLTSSQTNTGGTINTLNSKYPYVISNSRANYASGTLSGTFFGSTYKQTRRIDKSEVASQKKDIVSFLTNKKPKVIKDWNGNIYLCQVIGNITCDSIMLSGGLNISFSFVEIGDFANTDDLIYSGMFEGDLYVT